MKILSLGATGAIGSQLAVLLVQAGHDLHITTRQIRSPVDGITFIKGDARDDSFLKEVLRNKWDVIVDFMIYDTVGFSHRVDTLLEATQQYVFTSTARVFADSDTPLTERSPRLLEASNDAEYLATDEYALTKARQEDLLYASGKTNWTIIRPYITFGDGRLQLGTLEKEGWLYRALQGRSIVFCDPLMEKITTLTDAVDVARMINALIGHSEALGNDYNLTGGEAVTWSQVLSLYLDVLEMELGRRPRVVLQDLDTFCTATKNVAQIKYDRMYNRRFDTQKISKHFDLTLLHKLLPSLVGKLQSQINNRHSFRELDWRNEALRDRLVGEHARLTEIQGLKSKLRYIGYRHLSLNAINRARPGAWFG